MNNKIKWRGDTIELVPCPTLMAIGLARTEPELEVMDHSQQTALGAAALAACWPPDKSWPTRLRPRPWGPGKRVDLYGQEVFENLAAAKIPTRTLISACGRALAWAWESGLIADDEIEEVEGNSDTPGEPD